MATKKQKTTEPLDHGHPNPATGGDLLTRNLPLLARSMTFSKMVRANLRAIPNIKDLSWLFPPVCHR